MPIAAHIDLDLFQRVTQNQSSSQETAEVLQHLTECDRCLRIVPMMKSQNVLLGMAALLWGEDHPKFSQLQRKLNTKTKDPATQPARFPEPMPIPIEHAQGQEEGDRRWVTLPEFNLDDSVADEELVPVSRKNNNGHAVPLGLDRWEKNPQPNPLHALLQPREAKLPTPVDNLRHPVQPVNRIDSYLPRPDVSHLGQSTMEAVRFLDAPKNPSDLGQLAHYRIIRVLGTGGLGIVYQGQDEQLKRMVAIKTLKHGSYDMNVARERFLREARAVAALEHENIIAVYQVGEWKGEPFMVMPMLQGETLETRIDREKKLPALEAMRIIQEVARGLRIAHERGLFHRDIKPANIWLEAGTGKVKILDFGLARATSEELQLTRTGTVVGTPAFMSPEQAKGVIVDHRTDFYSLGAVLYLMLTGKPPLEAADTMAMLLALQYDQPKPITELAPLTPPPLVGLANRLLAKLPEGRPDNADEILDIIYGIERKLPHIAQVVEAQAGANKSSLATYFTLLVLFGIGISALWWGPMLAQLLQDKTKPTNSSSPVKAKK